MTTYANLNQRNPNTPLTAQKLQRLLYLGGAELKKCANLILPQHPGEPEHIYAGRLHAFIHRPYFASVIDHFMALLLADRPNAVPTRGGRELHGGTEYYDRFKTDCDKCGHDVAAFFKALFTTAIVEGQAWLLIHDPIDMSGGEQPKNRSTWEQRGLGEFWVTQVQNEDVFDYETDDNGSLIFAVVHSSYTFRNDPNASRDNVTEAWDVYTRHTVERFQITYPKSKPPGPDDEIPSLGVRFHPLNRLPLMCVQLDPSQHLGARLESPQLALDVALNQESWSISRAAFAMPVFYLSDKNIAPKMGAGWALMLDKDEKVEWLEPACNHLDALDRTIRTHKDELFRVAAAMALGVENNAASVGRSAQSKQADADASKVALSSFADVLREEIGRLFKTLSDVRGDDIVWEITGLADFNVAAYLDALKKLNDATGGIHSPTARAALEGRAIEALLPDQKPDTRDRIRKEILHSIVNEPTPAQQEAETFAAMHAVAAGHDHTPRKSKKPTKQAA